jgi:hypothetical protein
MPHASRFVSLFTITVLALSAVTARAQTVESPERIAASFVLAQGRVPTADERARFTAPEPQSFAQLLARQREQLQANPAAQRAVIVKAWQDAFGRTPGEAEGAVADRTGTYTELMTLHLQWLAGNPAEYEQVMHRAYRFLLQRDAYPAEIDYWKRQAPRSYALLVACIEDWARRNQPGLMETTGVPTVAANNRFLATVRLAPAAAAEARAAAGLEVANAALALAAGRNLLAVGADRIAASGGIHFVAAGAADLVP